VFRSTCHQLTKPRCCIGRVQGRFRHKSAPCNSNPRNVPWARACLVRSEVVPKGARSINEITGNTPQSSWSGWPLKQNRVIDDSCERPAVREHLVSGLQSPISNLSTAGVRRSGQQTIHHLNLVPGYCLHTAYHQHSCSSLATTSTNIPTYTAIFTPRTPKRRTHPSRQITTTIPRELRHGMEPIYAQGTPLAAYLEGMSSCVSECCTCTM
jgi:hypothetical protein